MKSSFSYPGAGWGLTTHDHTLFLSDGTSTIRVLDPKTFQERRHIEVRDGGEPVAELNELEFVQGELFANVWHTDRIVRISPQSGKVLGWINLAGLLSPMYQKEGSEAVLNGIAYDSQRRRLLVTGKLWPSVFEIRVIRTGRREGPDKTDKNRIPLQSTRTSVTARRHSSSQVKQRRPFFGPPF